MVCCMMCCMMCCMVCYMLLSSIEQHRGTSSSMEPPPSSMELHGAASSQPVRQLAGCEFCLPGGGEGPGRVSAGGFSQLPPSQNAPKIFSCIFLFFPSRRLQNLPIPLSQCPPPPPPPRQTFARNELFFFDVFTGTCQAIHLAGEGKAEAPRLAGNFPGSQVGLGPRLGRSLAPENVSARTSRREAPGRGPLLPVAA